jgi:hypothetical protein
VVFEMTFSITPPTTPRSAETRNAPKTHRYRRLILRSSIGRRSSACSTRNRRGRHVTSRATFEPDFRLLLLRGTRGGVDLARSGRGRLLVTTFRA